MAEVLPPGQRPGVRPAPGGAGAWRIRGQRLARDAVAGLVASVVLIANIVSFAALMFPDALAAGTPAAVWAMLIGSCVGGLWIAWATSIPPLATGIDSPTGAVLVLLGAAAGSSALAAGASAQSAIQTVMTIFTAATLLTGALLYGLGALRLGHYFRFVPYFVVAGFLAATGWFLIAGGLRMTTGRALSIDGLAATWSVAESARLAGAVGTLLVLLALRRWVQSTLALPAALLLLWLAAALALRQLGLAAPEQGWYLPSLGRLTPWAPWEALASASLTGAAPLALLPEIVAVAIVALISLVTKVSSLEVARKTWGDLDCEFRAHGIASLVAAPLGGIVSSLQTGTSRLLEHAGGATRGSGIACALILGGVALAGFDLPGLVPIPLVAGLILYLGYIFIVDALARPLARRAWLDLALALAIAAICIRYGYVVGVIGGVVSACLIFAATYARVGVVRRHLTRAQFASHVSRPAEASSHLSETGHAVQLYWLSGYIFFGSSESVFEQVRRDIEAVPAGRVCYVVLDFGMVSGVDASATASLAKLRNFCQRQAIALVFCGLSPPLQRTLQRDQLAGGRNHPPSFDDVNRALAWCEDQLLTRAQLDRRSELTGFESWLQRELGAQVRCPEFLAYLIRRDVAESQVLYREGDPSDHIDLVAAGSLVVEVATPTGEALRVRSITTHTVVGEMGFFRRSLRSATVSSDGPATFFSLTRENFERMRRERPDLASAFDNFILRVLADRIHQSDRMVVALSR